MNRTISTTFATLALLLVFAAPAMADGDGNGQGTGHGNETSEEARNKTNQAAAAVVYEVCRLVHVQWTNIQLITDPLLGIVDFDPDECYDIVVEGPFYTWSYRYEPTE